MKTKDYTMLEEAYLKVLKEQDDKYAPNDPEMQELSKQDPREVYDQEDEEETPNISNKSPYQKFISDKANLIEEVILKEMKTATDEASDMFSEQDQKDPAFIIMNIVDHLLKCLNSESFSDKVLNTQTFKSKFNFDYDAEEDKFTQNN